MKTFLSLTLFALILLFSACTKSTDTITHTNCDGLVNDTLGAGDNGRIYMQNGFTPNGDGVNDVSRPILQNISSFTFSIYDDNNNVLFTTSTPGQGWSTTVGSNTFVQYYYRVQATTSSSHHIGICGSVWKLSCFPVGFIKSTLHFEDQLLPGGTYSATSVDYSLPNCP